MSDLALGFLGGAAAFAVIVSIIVIAFIRDACAFGRSARAVDEIYYD